MMQFENAVQLRRELHALAELSGHEIKTSQYIAEKLRSAGYEPQTNVGGYGVVAVLSGARPGPVIMLRADTDALPFPDEDHPGETVAIHACGHDAHAAMLLSLALYMKSAEPLECGEIRFVFQPAEESLEGALGMIRDGVLDGVDFAVGSHIRPVQDIPAGTFCAAVRHSASSTVRALIRGRAAHAARPHLGVNVLEAAALISLTSMQRLNPAETWSIKPTRMACEPGASNSLATWASVTFDVRAATNQLMAQESAGFERAVEAVRTAFGAEIDVETPESCPAADYDPALVALMAETITETFGREALAADCGGGGEDFHFYKQMKPELRTVYFGIGAGAAPGLHDRAMSFDESALPKGAKLLHAFVRKLLRN